MSRKTARRKTKRVRLGEALVEAIDPLMTSWGYHHPSKAEAKWNVSPVRYIWKRQRGEHTDWVAIFWNKHSRAIFYLGWDTTEPGRKLDRQFGGFQALLGWRFKLGRFDCEGSSIGVFSSIDHSVRLAIRRLEELEAYFASGVPTLHLGFYPPASWIWLLNPKTPPLKRWRRPRPQQPK